MAFFLAIFNASGDMSIAEPCHLAKILSKEIIKQPDPHPISQICIEDSFELFFSTSSIKDSESGRGSRTKWLTKKTLL